MTYALSWPLQQAVYAALIADPAVSVLSGGRIHDAPPHAATQTEPGAIYVTLGEETVRPFESADHRGGAHDFAVTVHSGASGFGLAKELAGAICDALIDRPLPMSRGHLVALRFLGGQAQRGRPADRRRITLRFRALVEDG
ncbi:MAG: hypothetical protein KatS3mg118_1113 [Paracoccaceae bacterium]|nr:MAG: hypothetical protein KatS3mg118_1113 [Paracoccaceae bacterium]